MTLLKKKGSTNHKQWRSNPKRWCYWKGVDKLQIVTLYPKAMMLLKRGGQTTKLIVMLQPKMLHGLYCVESLRSLGKYQKVRSFQCAHNDSSLVQVWEASEGIKTCVLFNVHTLTAVNTAELLTQSTSALSMSRRALKHYIFSLFISLLRSTKYQHVLYAVHMSTSGI